jgi:hypothetical protein
MVAVDAISAVGERWSPSESKGTLVMVNQQKKEVLFVLGLTNWVAKNFKRESSIAARRN